MSGIPFLRQPGSRLFADSLLTSAWIFASGGFYSSYYVILYVCIIAVAFRFSLRTTMLVAVIYAATYFGLLATLNELQGNIMIMVMRTGFIFIVGYFTHLITRETLIQTEKRMDLEHTAHLARMAEEQTRRSNEELEALVRARTHDLEESLQRFTTLMEMMPNLAWTSNPQGEPTYFNRAWNAFTGGDSISSEILQRYILEEDKAVTLEKWGRSIRTGTPLELEYRWRRYDGQVRWMLARANPVRNAEGRIIAWIGTATDIHAHKMAEQQMEEKVRERTMQLSTANEELQRSNAELEQFAYIASHDLKEPLRMIAAYTELIDSRIASSTPEVNEFAGYVHDGVRRMQALIDDILQYSRIGSIKNNVGNVNINAVLKETATVLAGKVEESGAALVYNDLPEVSGNRTLLQQLFQNLVENAIKFHRKGVAPLVEIKACDADEFWRFSVSDNGIGMSPDYYEKIFVIFQRLHSAQEFPGTGIGLSICKKIVEQQGGRIWVKSEEGAGTTFYFTLRKA